MFKESDTLTGMLGKDVEIRGTLITKKLLRFDGKLVGKIFSEDEIIVGEGGVIEGDIFCNNLKLDGKIKGNIYCMELAELKENSQVLGNIYSKRLELHDHGYVNGKVFVGKFSENHLTESFKRIREEILKK